MQKDRRVIAAILAADVVEYSRLMAADEPGTLAALSPVARSSTSRFASFGGREFGSVGDSLMAEFHSAVNAVAAALAIQERVAAENSALPRDRQMVLRIGIISAMSSRSSPACSATRSTSPRACRRSRSRAES